MSPEPEGGPGHRHSGGDVGRCGAPGFAVILSQKPVVRRFFRRA